METTKEEYKAFREKKKMNGAVIKEFG